MIVKICGVTRPDDAVAAVRAGADWIGINFWPESKRYCEVAPSSVSFHTMNRRFPSGDMCGS